ncbi:MAG: ribosomal subunit interface protein [Candidatus Glassbacteria bacterium RIFCSPLOWO2_12_FULL_58_11]|uniref:Ribosomal subunit interface protein n=2 Tax=Candidatus Glassiibacteriota TaxID=1817805 RepID=A0A1F5YWQ4_9BACT|nr:MAG: ribosomal subunit interface protein [Candidatus Glassbacteria bacterium GWA2_58_10]OGG04513.1 MAG: ribosomal subunit interface protein [Candidatus Glassbacteria bacterium RIFCSPLOWO2_12_FULL_58_11]
MQITITRKNANVSESLKEYVESKLSILIKHYGKIIDAHVVMDNEGNNQVVEITLRVSGHSIFSKHESTNLRAAFDTCVIKIDKQLRKLKGKIQRKALTSEEAALSGKLITPRPVDEVEEQGSVEPLEPVLTFDQDEDEPEEKTGT